MIHVYVLVRVYMYACMKSHILCIWIGVYVGEVLLHHQAYMFIHVHVHTCTSMKRLFILEMSFHDLHYLSSLPHPFSSLSPNMHTAVHMHEDSYMTCMFDLFYSFTPYQDNATPLYVASRKGHHDVVQTLVGAGADVNIATSVSDMVLHVCSYTCTLTSYGEATMLRGTQ